MSLTSSFVEVTNSFVIHTQVEAELKTSPYIENMCVYGDSFREHLIAIVLPNEPATRALATQLGFDGDDKWSNLCNNATITGEITKRVIEHGKKAGLHKTEIPTAIKLCADEWTPDSGLVTAALKIRRKPIKERYQADIDELYGKTDKNMNPVCNGNATTRVVKVTPTVQ